MKPLLCLMTVCSLAFSSATLSQAADPLPSWNDGASKTAILQFVEESQNADGDQFIPVAERIAVFDNDGTLWSEQPAYFQLLFAIDRIREMAKDHPEWKTEQPYKAVLDGDLKALAASGKEGILKVVATTHAGMTTEEFDAIAREWLETARHPKTGRLYPEMVYQPMLELLDLLHESDFEVYIVSGGGVDFIRAFANKTYGIPPERTIGSMIETEFKMQGGKATLVRTPKIAFIDDGPGKPIAIQKIIGRRPVFAFGNSDGDLQMQQWTASGSGPYFCGIVHHTDAEREWAYDRDSHIGRLDKALTEADKLGWTVVDMKNEWRVIYPEASTSESE
ncbi:MAG: haloacid dehalogenase [Planctomyces sp.]|nr:haloacid dehalogenase [Planctomyces sp.]